MLCTTDAIFFLLQICRGFWPKPLIWSAFIFEYASLLLCTSQLWIGFIYGRRVEALFDEWYYQCNLSASAKIGGNRVFFYSHFRPSPSAWKWVTFRIFKQTCEEFVHVQVKLTANLQKASEQGFDEGGKYVERRFRGGWEMQEELLGLVLGWLRSQFLET